MATFGDERKTLISILPRSIVSSSSSEAPPEKKPRSHTQMPEGVNKKFSSFFSPSLMAWEGGRRGIPTRPLKGGRRIHLKFRLGEALSSLSFWLAWLFPRKSHKILCPLSPPPLSRPIGEEVI